MLGLLGTRRLHAYRVDVTFQFGRFPLFLYYAISKQQISMVFSVKVLV